MNFVKYQINCLYNNGHCCIFKMHMKDIFSYFTLSLILLTIIINYLLTFNYNVLFLCFQLDWFAFAIMSLPAVVAPFMLWWVSKSKYELILKQKREKVLKD